MSDRYLTPRLTDVWCHVLVQERAHSAPLELSARFAQAPDQALPDQVHHWELHSVAVSSQLLDYIPGRDALVSAPEMAAGLDAHDSSSGEHVLWAAVLPSSALDLARPFVLRCNSYTPEASAHACFDMLGRSSPLLASDGQQLAHNVSLRGCNGSWGAKVITHQQLLAEFKCNFHPSRHHSRRSLQHGTLKRILPFNQWEQMQLQFAY